MAYFKNVNTLEELRKQYKELLKKYHPDNANGSTEATQQINAEYEQLFKILKNKHENISTNDTQANYSNNMYDWENDKALREVLEKIIHFSNITIEIVGNWIWTSGDTYFYKKELKELGFKWASIKKQWYWHSETFRKKGKKTLSKRRLMRTANKANERQPFLLLLKKKLFVLAKSVKTK